MKHNEAVFANRLDTATIRLIQTEFILLLVRIHCFFLCTAFFQIFIIEYCFLSSIINLMPI